MYEVMCHRPASDKLMLRSEEGEGFFPSPVVVVYIGWVTLGKLFKLSELQFLLYEMQMQTLLIQ